MEPSREIFWNIQFGEILYFLGVIAIATLVYSIYRRTQIWHLGSAENRPKNPGHRIWKFIELTFVDGVFHLKFLGLRNKDLRPKEIYPGLAHFLIFVGCIIFLIGAFLDFISHYFFDFMHGSFYLGYSVATDGFGILAIIGVILAIVRRYGLKPGRLDNKKDDLVALMLILVVIVTGFLVEGLRIAATELKFEPAWAPWSPGGYVLALTFSSASEGALLLWHRGIWWFHMVLGMGAIVYVSLYYTKLFHIIWDPVNVFFRNLGPKGALQPINLETTETFGVSKIEQFTWKQLLDLDACTRCGRCQDACPAYFSGKVLNPKKVIQDLKTHFGDVYPVPVLGMPKPAEKRKDLITEVITDEVIWDCTTCRACMQACPVAIEHVDKIIDMRRNLAMERSQFPEEVQNTLKSLGTRGHPYRGTTATRTSWAEELDIMTMADDNKVEWLYWVGCSAALEDRNMKVAKAIASILKRAGVSFAILGDEESCCGDPARRMGDEYLFQTLCRQNIEIMKNHNIKKILTTCPHCFNTLKHEYPQFCGNYEVVHHTQFLASLIKDGKLVPGRLDGAKIAYHDSCYLGRYNDIYQEPRAILGTISGVKGVELGRHQANSFCCGGGGGHMWMEEAADKRVNTRRVEEIVQAKVDMVATACPYCLSMFEDGVKAKGVEETLYVKDLSELIADSLGKEAKA